jgi:hypothetical protein
MSKNLNEYNVTGVHSQQFQKSKKNIFNDEDGSHHVKTVVTGRIERDKSKW